MTSTTPTADFHSEPEIWILDRPGASEEYFDSLSKPVLDDNKFEFGWFGVWTSAFSKDDLVDLHDVFLQLPGNHSDSQPRQSHRDKPNYENDRDY